MCSQKLYSGGIIILNSNMGEYTSLEVFYVCELYVQWDLNGALEPGSRSYSRVTLTQLAPSPGIRIPRGLIKANGLLLFTHSLSQSVNLF